jgi:TM2 domain-containing membrane protein YozV
MSDTQPTPNEATGPQYSNTPSFTGVPKSKVVSILLAVFFSFFTWLYTYKTDSNKFWIGAVLSVVGIFLWFFFLGWLVWLPLWIWSIVDTATKPDAWYAHYPNEPVR